MQSHSADPDAVNRFTGYSWYYIAGGSRWTELPFPAGLERIKETRRMGSCLWTDFLQLIYWVCDHGFICKYLPKKTDVVNSACITATANHGFEVFTAIGIFGIVGFMAGQQGVDVAEVAGGGVAPGVHDFPDGDQCAAGVQCTVCDLFLWRTVYCSDHINDFDPAGCYCKYA